MDRYEMLSQRQRSILDKIYWYLGFNELITFEQYIEYIFRGVKSGTDFALMLNRNMDFIITMMKEKWEDYRYFTCYWLTEDTALGHFEVGGKEEYDPKGVLKMFIKKHFKDLNRVKI